MFRTRTLSLVLSYCLIWRVGGEFDRVLEVEMYGSRPGNVDSLVVPSRDYYKYEELSDNNIEEKVTGHTTQSVEEEALAGYQKKVSGRNRKQLVVDDEALAAVDAELIERSGPGSCYQCSTLTDTTGLCQDIGRYHHLKTENKSNLPQFENKCSNSAKFCQVRRVDYKVDNMKGYAQWSLERACVQECDPFCVSMGGRTKVTYCTSCCRWDGFTRDAEGIWESGPRNDLCNMDNSAAKDRAHVALALFLLLELYYY